MGEVEFLSGGGVQGGVGWDAVTWRWRRLDGRGGAGVGVELILADGSTAHDFGF